MSRTPLAEFTPHSNCPYLLGVYLAVNAIPDAYLYVDGPDCSFFKAQFIYGKHDLASTLLDCAGDHRVRFSWVDVNGIVEDRSALLAEEFRILEANENAAAVLLASMPMATITGVQYDTIVRGLDPPFEKPFFEIPGHSLAGDWLDGYGATLEALAAGIDLKGGKPADDKVAVVGYFMDRTERDHVGNVEELERMLGALGLEVVSVWPSAREYAHLQRVREAGVIISLPHGRKAARALAARTGARLIEAGLPFGIGPTVDWLSGIAAELGRERQASEFIDAQLARLVPGVQWFIGKYFLDSRILFVGDPHLFEPFAEFMAELGATVAGLVAIAMKHHLDPLPDSLVRRGIPCIFEPNPEDHRQLYGGDQPGESLDLAILSDFFGAKGGKIPAMQFGFPSYRWHALFDAPFLGFAGAAWFIDRMANAMMAAP